MKAYGPVAALLRPPSTTEFNPVALLACPPVTTLFLSETMFPFPPLIVTDPFEFIHILLFPPVMTEFVFPFPSDLLLVPPLMVDRSLPLPQNLSDPSLPGHRRRGCPFHRRWCTFHPPPYYLDLVVPQRCPVFGRRRRLSLTKRI